MVGIKGLPKLELKKPYAKRPLVEHSMLTKGALHMPEVAGESLLKGLMHPASAAMSEHIENGAFSGESKGWGNA